MLYTIQFEATDIIVVKKEPFLGEKVQPLFKPISDISYIFAAPRRLAQATLITVIEHLALPHRPSEPSSSPIKLILLVPIDIIIGKYFTWETQAYRLSQATR